MKSIAIRLLAVAVVVTGFAAFSQSEAQAGLFGRCGGRSRCCQPVCQPVCCETSSYQSSCCDSGCHRGGGHRLFGGRRGCCGHQGGCNSGCGGGCGGYESGCGGCGGCGGSMGGTVVEGTVIEGGEHGAPTPAPEAPKDAPEAPATTDAPVNPAT